MFVLDVPELVVTKADMRMFGLIFATLMKSCSLLHISRLTYKGTLTAQAAGSIVIIRRRRPSGRKVHDSGGESISVFTQRLQGQEYSSCKLPT